MSLDRYEMKWSIPYGVAFSPLNYWKKRSTNPNLQSFRAVDLNSQYYGTYDFIIVGGGAGGGVLANRLTEIENFTVLVVEAGKVDPPISRITGLAAYLRNSDWNWGYWSTVQTKGCLGGGSSINWAIHVRGNAADLDKWEDLGNSGWSYSDCLPYFKKSQFGNSSVDIDTDYQGTDGPQSITVAEDTPTLTQEIINAFTELGKTEGDYNGADQYNVGRIQYFQKYNVRSTTANAYVRPVLNRTNLELIFDALVTKIDISNNTATGIQFWQNGTLYSATASKEVILSAGAIGSPQLLLLSVIGPQEEWNITSPLWWIYQWVKI
ncbi:oxygen-dependent choline dehydrogenase-like [Dendroctonus ponderosae]|uniref:oxygen-dependent choline dehydrogenase-like n=1 Tax=Dendroctonus ponderosae TaxID=77166 RepID=UPI0020363DE4|nr:oxygen-dependent choline dehydrogenase-like [Dendroctonus ponderosae]